MQFIQNQDSHKPRSQFKSWICITVRRLPHHLKKCSLDWKRSLTEPLNQPQAGNSGVWPLRNLTSTLGVTWPWTWGLVPRIENHLTLASGTGTLSVWPLRNFTLTFLEMWKTSQLAAMCTFRNLVPKTGKIGEKVIGRYVHLFGRETPHAPISTLLIYVHIPGYLFLILKDHTSACVYCGENKAKRPKDSKTDSNTRRIADENLRAWNCKLFHVAISAMHSKVFGHWALWLCVLRASAVNTMPSSLCCLTPFSVAELRLKHAEVTQTKY